MGKGEDVKIRIPHSLEAGCTLVGVLHCVANDRPNQETLPQTRKIALILHGFMGHKDYLFQKHLAYQLPIDSFRFDFRGNHESNGSFSGLEADIQDISVVASHLAAEYGCHIQLVIGHSGGSIAAMKWLSISPEGQRVSGFVNVSGRKRMGRINYPGFEPGPGSPFDFAMVSGQVAGKQVSRKIYRWQRDFWNNWDTSYVRTEFPPDCDVLTIHGLRDQLVPPYDAILYAKAFTSRNGERSGTHTLHFIEEADHNFIGHHAEVVGTILDWWRLKQRGGLRDGLWGAGETERGKL